MVSRFQSLLSTEEPRGGPAESRNASIEALKEANSPDARSVVLELDETDTVDGVELPGADLSGEELIIQASPRPRTNSPATPASLSATFYPGDFSADGQMFCHFTQFPVGAGAGAGKDKEGLLGA
jgi:hypothetical protein